MELQHTTAQAGSIYYLIPDISRRQFQLWPLIKAAAKGQLLEHIKQRWLAKHKPVGGVKVMLQHCMLLQELGFNAIPIRLGRYEGNFYGYNIQSRHISQISLNLRENDVVVCPEICPSAALQFKGGRKVMFVQNWIHLYEFNRFPGEQIIGPYTWNGFDKVMCCSAFLTKKLKGEPDNDVSVINNFIDLDSFARADERRIPNRVLALPRKNAKDLKAIMKLVEHQSVDFRLVDGLSQQALIEEYQAADIFLATGYPEGFGLPPLEAMACGAVVVGFTGGGADEFMRDGETALVAPDGNCEKAAEKLLQILSDPALKERLRERSRTTALQYHKNRTKEELQAFFSELFESRKYPADPAPSASPCTYMSVADAR